MEIYHISSFMFFSFCLMKHLKILYVYFKINVLWWHCLMILYKFQVYNLILQYLHTPLCVHHPVSIFLLLPYILTPLPTLVSSYPSLPLVTTILLLVSMNVLFVCFICSFCFVHLLFFFFIYYIWVKSCGSFTFPPGLFNFA